MVRRAAQRFGPGAPPRGAAPLLRRATTVAQRAPTLGLRLPAPRAVVQRELTLELRKRPPPLQPPRGDSPPPVHPARGDSPPPAHAPRGVNALSRAPALLLWLACSGRSVHGLAHGVEA
mmetsp:Transcript_16053/g.51414  ORF Transcript_16053/g.51414 Transcript_16053/m.51414 type:complete len:119 (+) Transcript_16053:775-1131(+)